MRTDRGLERSVLLLWHVCVCVAAAIESGVVCVVARESSVFFVPSCVLYITRQARATFQA